EQVEDDRLGPARGDRAQRVLGGCCGVDLVARASEVRLEGAQDLGLVVDDEDPRAAHASGSAGSATTRCAPRSAGSAQTRPPFACATPRATARPSPAPRAPPGAPRCDRSEPTSRPAR